MDLGLLVPEPITNLTIVLFKAFVEFPQQACIDILEQLLCLVLAVLPDVLLKLPNGRKH